MRHIAMELWRRRKVRVRRRRWSAAAMAAWLGAPVPALAENNVLAPATLPRDLRPWGMYLNADPVVKAVLIGLAFASIVPWTVWLAKSVGNFFCKHRRRAGLKH